MGNKVAGSSQGCGSDPRADAQDAPSQWKLVPVYPAREMWAAGADAAYGVKQRLRCHHDKLVGAIWNAMLAATPEPPFADVERRAYERALEDWLAEATEAGDAEGAEAATRELASLTAEAQRSEPAATPQTPKITPNGASA